jgi:hypothetical protein
MPHRSSRQHLLVVRRKFFTLSQKASEAIQVAAVARHKGRGIGELTSELELPRWFIEVHQDTNDSGGDSRGTVSRESRLIGY